MTSATEGGGGGVPVAKLAIIRKNTHSIKLNVKNLFFSLKMAKIQMRASF